MSGLMLRTLETISDGAYEQLVKRTPDGFSWWGKQNKRKIDAKPHMETPRPRLIETLISQYDIEQLKVLYKLLGNYHMTFAAELAEIDQERRDAFKKHLRASRS